MLIGNIYVSLDWKTDFGSRIWLDNFRKDGRPGWLWDGKKNGCRCITKERRSIRITPRDWVMVLRKGNCVYYNGGLVYGYFV